ncbi:MAG: cardiolipin synthase B, partial [Alphaproteobacteria bacterium]|nr:cardiolipin synthase B [Alphaproteobacteria bacterium]
AQIEALLDGGVEIWRFMPTMLHNKLVLVDDDVTCVGSANLNLRSLRKDDEVSVIVLQRRLAEVLNDHYQSDLQRAELMTPEAFANRGIRRRILERLSHVIKPET